MLQNEEQIKKIMMYFTWIESMVRINNDFAYTDINISIETFILELLNLMELGDYSDCNIKKVNYPSIDLINNKKNIGIQITSETRSKKIKETLSSCPNLKIKFFFLDSSYSPRNKTFTNYPAFSVENDIYNFKKIIKLLKVNPQKINHLIEFLELNIVLPVRSECLKEIFGGYEKYQQETILKDIKQTCERFVPTSITTKCLKHLETKNLLVLIGNPGVGKSYNSKFLVAKYLEKGYKLLYSPNKYLKDILNQYNDKEKFILFIDDIFGSNNIDFMSTTSDYEIVSLLENTKDNLKIIINSRTSYFNDVNEKYDKIGRLGLKPFIIETAKFSYVEKARILIKHLKLSMIPSKSIYSLFEKGNFYIYGIKNPLNIYRIIYHKNYNPRLIELITRIEFVPSDDLYINNVIKNLDNPSLVYDHSYNNNLNENEKKIIKVIYLKSIYKNNYEIDVNELCSHLYKLGINEEEFKISLRKLEKSFISLDTNDKRIVCKFYDPSIMDYCINKFKNSIDMNSCVELIEEKEELDNILLNEKIDIEIKKREILKFNYSNFKVLKLLESEIATDVDLCNHIKSQIFCEEHSFSADEDYFCKDKFISETEIIDELMVIENIGKYISYSCFGFGNEITEIVFNNFDKFSEERKEEITDYVIDEINDLINSEIKDYISSQNSKKTCDEENLLNEYNQIINNIIFDLRRENIDSNIIFKIKINMESFVYENYTDYIDNCFTTNNDNEMEIDKEKRETINIVDNYYKSIL